MNRILKILPHLEWMIDMTPLKPYMVRALYEWIVDNGLTPYLLVDAMHPGASLPLDYEQDGRIVLNIRPEAVQHLHLGNDQLTFNARFGGRPMRVEVPTTAILALYAKENGRGMVFDEEESDVSHENHETDEDDHVALQNDNAPSNPTEPVPGKERSHLKVVK